MITADDVVCKCYFSNLIPLLLFYFIAEAETGHRW